MALENQQARVSIYVDGFNLYKGALQSNSHLKWLNIVKLASFLAPEKLLVEAMYFTAEIAPTFTGDKAPDRQKLYLRALEISGTTVVKGNFRVDPRWMPIHDQLLTTFTRPEAFSAKSKLAAAKVFTTAVGPAQTLVTKFEEKRSDVNLASHLLRDVYESKITHAIVVSGDTDLTTAIKFASAAGCHVSVIIPSRHMESASLQGVANYVAWLKSSTLGQCQLDRVLISPRGKQIIRPQEWA